MQTCFVWLSFTDLPICSCYQPDTVCFRPEILDDSASKGKVKQPPAADDGAEDGAEEGAEEGEEEDDEDDPEEGSLAA